ncbi:TetR/AcrR family transcriptional regulator [Arthrobacter livingstonensis]|uniref:TetR/AcrR family transcriptional regulator n=2 Tax=Arthrobacter livingstonensis TaxID=670078 RepID=A0A2V5LNP3_9MICC|nr:TetR/AcrR family transcriptional regulator [Arthrobacter livingstonensis]
MTSTKAATDTSPRSAPKEGSGVVPAEQRRQRLSPDERREQIFACAQKLFALRPYEEVSATDIAAAAGVARGLVNHYFGNKRGLYLEVVRLNSTVSEVAVATLPDGTLQERIDASVTWFLDTLEHTGGTWLALGSGGMGRDPDLERILVEAENDSVERLMEAMGLAGRGEGQEQVRAMMRVYAQLARSGAREWLLRKTLSRRQVHTLLSGTLLGIVRDAVPALTPATGPHRGPA